MAAMLVSACATGGRDSEGHPRTALERSIGQCVVSIGLGALLGALAGAAANRHGGAGTGAAIGAGVGSVACIVLIALNNEQDRERIRQAQQQAYNSGRSSTTQYVGQDGTARVVKVSLQNLPAPSAGPVTENGETIVGPCRRAQTSITLADKGTVALDPEIVCRTALGDYVPYGGKLTV